MRTLSSIVVMMTTLGAAACGEKTDETVGASDGSTSSGSTGGISAGTTTAPTTSTTAEPTGTDTTDTDTSGTTGTTTTEGATGTTTSGPSCADCGPDEWCDIGPNSCAGDPSESMCQPKPQGCDGVYAPVCGCDGQVYSSGCEAAAAGVDVAEAGGCAPPEGYFPCGYAFCDLATTYCEVQVSDVGGFPNLYQCKGLPNNCEPPSCDCLADEVCGGMCEPVEGGGLKTICPGG